MYDICQNDNILHSYTVTHDQLATLLILIQQSVKDTLIITKLSLDFPAVLKCCHKYNSNKNTIAHSDNSC